MAAAITLLCAGFSLLLVLNVHCEDDIVTVIKRIDDLDESIIQIQKDLPSVEEKVLHRIASAKLSIKSDLEQNIQQLVKNALLEILEGESIEEMVRSEVITEVRQLKQSHEEMKKELNRLQMLLNNSRGEETGSEEQNTTEIQEETAETLRKELLQCRIQLLQKDEKNEELRQCLDKLNQTCPLPRTETSTSTTVTTSTTTTPNPNARGRIILAPINSSLRNRFQIRKFETWYFSTYRLAPIDTVTAVSYMPKLRKLVIARRDPHYIYSSNLDSNDRITLLTGVISYGMAVDNELGIVFLTTDHPKKTISRMTTEGEDLLMVADVRYEGNYPRAIAINPKAKLIYACNHNKVFVVSYDGTNLHSLYRGDDMFSLTLDDTGSVLYFNDRKKIMKMTVPGNQTEVLLTTDVYPWTMRYYNHHLYYTSCCLQFGKFGDVDVGSNPVFVNTSSVYMERTRKYAVCLVH